jgi:hypothetical protein
MEIANQLGAEYPGTKELFDAINIRNYCDSANDLINGKYKKYI